MRKIVLACVISLLAACQWQEPAAAFGTIERELLLVNATSGALIT